MKIWIDFINSPQVQFFIPFIKEFKENNHETILTCRDSGNTIDLLEQHNLQFHIIGNKVGTGIIEKFMFFPRRLVKLCIFIKKHKPDIAVSQSSFYQPIVARILNIACLYTNDNEYAKGNIFGFVFATRVVLPGVLQDKNFTKKWPLKTKVTFYPGVKEAVYLSQEPELLSLANEKKSKIYFRPEPSTAQYYKGPLNFFDNTLIKLSEESEVIVLPRDNIQTEHYMQKKFHSLKVAQEPLSLHSIVSDCFLFIGAGGSMTRELAVLGVPVISVYQEGLLSVDKYLVEKGLLKINPDITYEEIKAGFKNETGSKKELSILDEGKESYSLLKNLIYNLK